jgi:hypothetical protein
MAAKKTKGAKKPVKKQAKNELVCQDCGMVVVVEDQCGCGCVPTCCGSPMAPKK